MVVSPLEELIKSTDQRINKHEVPVPAVSPFVRERLRRDAATLKSLTCVKTQAILLLYRLNYCSLY